MLKNKKNKVKFFQNQDLFANPQKLLTMEAPPFRYFCVTSVNMILLVMFCNLFAILFLV